MIIMEAAPSSRVGQIGLERMSSFFDRLPDSLVVRILTLGAADAADIVSESEASEDLCCIADASELCMLRPVCSRFAKLSLQVKNLLWDLNPYPREIEGRMVKFLHAAENVKILHLWPDNRPISGGMLAGALLAVPKLGGTLSEDEFDETMTLQLMEFLSSCHHVTSIMLLDCSPSLQRAVQWRHPFQNLEHRKISPGALTDTAVQSIMELCPVLQTVDLSGISGLLHPRLYSSSLKDLFLQTHGVDRLELFAPKLVSARLFDSANITIDATELRSLSMTCSKVQRVQPWKVEELTLYGAGWHISRELLPVLKLCNQTRKLGFAHSMEIEDEESHARLLLGALQGLESLEEVVLRKAMVRLPVGLKTLTFGMLRTLSIDLPEDEDMGMKLCKLFVEGSPKLEALVIKLKLGVKERDATLVKSCLSIQKRKPRLEIDIQNY
jgi:hypothetical protein